MSTENKKKHCLFSSMMARLWLIMMALVIFTIVLMWVIQILVLERNYTKVAIEGIQERLEPVEEQLNSEDLADNDQLIPYLSKTINGKLMIVDSEGRLEAIYSYGHQLDIDEDEKNIKPWQNIRDSEEYQSILDGESFSREVRERSQLISYEIGIPVLYNGEKEYIILTQNFTELNQVLDMNRRQLIFFSVLLMIASAILAHILSRKFTKPIHIIKGTVDDLAKGDLTAVPNLKLNDEVGQLADSVEELSRALRRVDDLRKEVIANVSHELRSPLALIGGYAEMVRDIHWKDEEKRTEDLNLIIRESKRMSEMVNDILDYSQLQTGYLQLKKEWYNLYEIVESEIMFCEPSAREYGIQLRFVSDETEIPVYVDALKMSQVIRNLLYNALNHTENKKEIIVSLKTGEDGCLVEVKNPGNPIPEEERELIWERYQRSQHQAGRREGTGLGLSIVSTILKAHGMTYGVDYQDQMTVFWFRTLKDEESK
ncbi:sensor histidine kinase [Sellimonas sp.]|uniref:sensor histidine kinase n=1 Tax=Sellimonas sp. TaxID=2021466 RepID=UPI00174C220C|nr:HAMP domain-containing sensor histidine kinase [Sellimonas sp.]